MALLKSIFSGRQLSSRDKTLIRFLSTRFGYRPKDLDLFHEALRHKSLSNINGEASNERLEFLGDAILDSVVAHYLYENFPSKDEGSLTRLKSKLVSRKTLGEIGGELELISVIEYKAGRSINITTLEGNAFEALIGAIYLDGGYAAVAKCLENHLFKNYVDLNQVFSEEIDFKSKLLIWSQRNRHEVDFDIVREDNLGGHWEYECLVRIDGQSWGKGTGTAKKKAEQQAAKETLTLMGTL